MKRRLFNIIAATLFLMSVGMAAMWIRSYFSGDYVHVGPEFYLSFARGYCRVVNDPWFFVPPYPVVGDPIVTYPIEKVGEYHLGSGAIYIPLWLLVAIFLAIGVLAYRIGHGPARYGLCPTCGYDLRATPERCPECGTIPTQNREILK